MNVVVWHHPDSNVMHSASYCASHVGALTEPTVRRAEDIQRADVCPECLDIGPGFPPADPETIRWAAAEYQRRGIWRITNDEYLATIARLAAEAAALPVFGPYRENPTGTAVCPHRDLSVCDDCAKDPAIVEVYGAHYHIPDADERTTFVDTFLTGGATCRS